MDESACVEPFEGVVINERTRLMNLIEGLFNEIEEWQTEESGEDETIEEHGIEKEMSSVQATKEESEDTWQESSGTNEGAIYQFYNDAACNVEGLLLCQEDLVPETSPQIFDSGIIDCQPETRLSLSINESGNQALSSYLQKSHNQSHVPSEHPEKCELDSTVGDLERRVDGVKERVSAFKARLDNIESEKQDRISSFSQLLEASYREKLDNLNQNIAIALENYTDADIRFREADEKFRLFYNNLQKQKYNYEAMKLQLGTNIAAAEKLNLLKIHGKLHLERKEALLNAQIEAEERDFDDTCAKKEADIDTLEGQYEIAQAKKRLVTGDITESEKEELLERIEEDNEFKDRYRKQTEIEQKSSEMEEMIKTQTKKIEELKMESLHVDEDIKNAKRVGKWKRRVLAFFCIRINDDDNIN